MKKTIRWVYLVFIGLILVISILVGVDKATAVYLNHAIKSKLSRADGLKIVGIGSKDEEILMLEAASKEAVDEVIDKISISGSMGHFLPLRCMCHGSVCIIFYSEGKEFERLGIAHRKMMFSEFGEKFQRQSYSMSNSTIDFLDSLIPNGYVWDGFYVKTKPNHAIEPRH